jgi:hypothetical protein
MCSGPSYWITEVAMLLIMLGALLELAGVVILVAQAIGDGEPAAPASPVAADSLEPLHRGGLFPLKRFRLGGALIALGALLLLIGGRI